MTQLSLPQVGLLCLIALGVGLVMGTSIDTGAFTDQTDAQVTVEPDRTNATLTADGLDGGIAVIAYGLNGSYGQTTTGYVDEQGRMEVVLPGLTPATRYRYRATLLEQDGSMTALGQGAFTTTPSTGGQPAGRPTGNITASDNPDQAEDAFDGDNETGWPAGGGGASDDGSGGSTDDGYEIQSTLTFSYDEKKDITGFGVLVGSEEGTGSVEFILSIRGEQFGPYTAQSGGSMQYFSLETIGQDFEIGVIDSTEGAGIQEFELRTEADAE